MCPQFLLNSVARTRGRIFSPPVPLSTQGVEMLSRCLDQSDWGSPVKKQHQITSHEGTESGRMVLGFLNHPSTTRTYSHCKRFQMVRKRSIKKRSTALDLVSVCGSFQMVFWYVRAHTNEPLQGQYLPRESPGREGPAPPTQGGALVTVARAAFPISV